MKQTQHEKIIELCLDGEYHCQNAFRELYIFSPHKRRSEIAARGTYLFLERPCEHGVRGQKDYRMVRKEEPQNHNPVSNYRCTFCPKTAVTYLKDKPVCQGHSVREVAPAGLF